MGFAKGNKIGNRWKKGQSGNPNGRRNAMKDILERIGSEEIKDGRTKKELVGERLYSMALNGDLGAIKELNDRTEGKPTQKQEIEVAEKITGWETIVETDKEEDCE